MVRATTKNMQSSADFVGEDKFMKYTDLVTAKSQIMEEPAEEIVPVLPHIQEWQQEEVHKEQVLIQQLQRALEQERRAERTGIQRPLPFDPEELEKRFLERMSDLGVHQAHCQTIIQSLRSIQEQIEPMSSMATTTKAELEYFQKLQPELAQRMLTLWENYQAQKSWKNRVMNTYTNVPLARTSTTAHLHPVIHRTRFRSSYQSAPHGDLADWLQQRNPRVEEGLEHEELPIRRWGRAWNVPGERGGMR